MKLVFSDSDLGDVHRVSLTWGDGTSTTLDVLGAGETVHTVELSHSYAYPGVYALCATVKDAAGAEDQRVYEYAVIYDPNGGFVTGGGWIESPAGAYLADQTLTGKATFGFEAKYKKGASVPSGSTQFKFHAGNLDFKSTNYQWLVVAGAKAQFKGTGTINGQGSYGFILTAVDGQVPGGRGVDRFRIKIWDIASGQIVYDNLSGAADTAEPTTALGGGSIVIHK